MSTVRDRVMLDRYAIRDISGKAKEGDSVVVSVQRQIGDDLELKESREIGIISKVGKDGSIFDILLINESSLEGEWEKLVGIPRTQFEILVEKSWFEICDRMVRGAAKAEPNNTAYLEELRQLLYEEAFLAGGRIIAGLGREDNLDLTFFNCFVKRIMEDSRQGIGLHFMNIFEIFSRGGGCGWSLDILRPKGSEVRGVNGKSSGVCSWATHFANITTTVEQGGSRRGASLQALSVWHPDILEFIHFKSQIRELQCPNCDYLIHEQLKRWEGSNVSVLVTDDFMEAVLEDREWQLVFPDTRDPHYNALWDGDLEKWKQLGKKIEVYKTLPATEIFNDIVNCAWASGDPGVIYIDKANKLSNSYYFAKLVCSNPCGEQFLPADGVCNLGHLNLAKFLISDFEQFPAQERPPTEAARCVDWDKLKKAIHVGVRFLDTITDLNKYHDAVMEKNAKEERRIGLGILGLGEMLVRIGIRYGSSDCIDFLNEFFDFFKTTSYQAGVALAKEKGPFPKFDAEKFLGGNFCKQLNDNLRQQIEEHGIRTVTVNTVAPTGSIGTMAGTSTGCEPYISLKWRALTRIGSTNESINIWEELESKFGEVKDWPSYVVTSSDIPAEEHVKVQATIQKHIDASISKTINLPKNATIAEVKTAYLEAYKRGCKGITVYRDGSKANQPLKAEPPAELEMGDTKVTIKILETLSAANGHGHGGGGILRPTVKKGLSLTDSRDTPIGTLHSTLRFHPVTGEPYDFFCESGGGDVGADTEAISRLISSILRWPDNAHIPQLVRLQIIEEQLHGIRGRGQVGYGPEAIFSLPDGVAKVLKEYLRGDVPLAGLPTGKDKVESFIDKVRSCQNKEELIEFIDTGLINSAGCGCGSESCACTQKPDTQHPNPSGRGLEYCPNCGNATLVTDGGCAYCIDQQCNYSAC